MGMGKVIRNGPFIPYVRLFSNLLSWKGDGTRGVFGGET